MSDGADEAGGPEGAISFSDGQQAFVLVPQQGEGLSGAFSSGPEFHSALGFGLGEGLGEIQRLGSIPLIETVGDCVGADAWGKKFRARNGTKWDFHGGPLE
jgi:hypothetical protein